MEKREAPGGGHWSRLHIVIACAGRHFKATGDRPGVREHCPRLTCIISLLHLHRVCPMSCARGHGGGRWRGKVWGDVWSSGPLTRPACLCISHRQDNPHGRLPSSCQGLGVWSLGGGHDLAADAWLAETRVRWSPCFSQVAGPPCFSQVAPSSMFSGLPIRTDAFNCYGRRFGLLATLCSNGMGSRRRPQSPPICPEPTDLCHECAGLARVAWPGRQQPFCLAAAARMLAREHACAGAPRMLCVGAQTMCARGRKLCASWRALEDIPQKRNRGCSSGGIRKELARSSHCVAESTNLPSTVADVRRLSMFPKSRRTT